MSEVLTKLGQDLLRAKRRAVDVDEPAFHEAVSGLSNIRKRHAYEYVNNLKKIISMLEQQSDLQTTLAFENGAEVGRAEERSRVGVRPGDGDMGG